MLNRDSLKSALQRTGLFPLARSAYRRLSPAIRREHRQELAFYKSVIPPGSVCFDVGANLGQRTELFLELGSRRVVLIEPNQACFSTLRFLFSSEPRVSIVPMAVGAQSGTVEFHSHGTDATASIDADWDKKVFGDARPQTTRIVEMTTLDRLIDLHGAPDYAKIDVEGYELEVLKGLSKPIKLISFEFHDDDMAKTRACLALLSGIGPISIRAASMDCAWLTERTRQIDECLELIARRKARGDMFVWSEGKASVFE